MLLVVGLVLYAGVASLTRPLTDAAAVAVAIPALVLLVQAGRSRPPVPAGVAGPRVRRTAAAWGAVVALALAWELAAWLQQPAYNVSSYDHPTASVLLDPVTEPWPLRWVAWCCWLYVGYRLVHRRPCVS
jgi:hypothetical protein